MTSPKISILIPTFNAEAYLGECLVSILEQRYSNIEVLIVDGVSTDNTLAVARSFGSLVTRIVCEPDQGQPDAVTKGLRLATGDIVHWHAADDVVLPGALGRVAGVFSSDPSCDLLFSDGLAFDGRRVVWGQHTRWLGFETSLYHFGRFQSDTAYWRREATAQALPLDISKPLNCDEDFFLRLWAGRRSRWSPEPLGAFRVRPGQVSQVTSAAGLEAARRDTREKIRAVAGIGPGTALLRTWLTWPYYAACHLAAPLAVSAIRTSVRIAKGQRDFGFMTESELMEWLNHISLCAEATVASAHVEAAR